MKPYLQTIPELMSVLDLFSGHHLQYLLFKCDHLFEGQNKNMDILFKTNEDYHKAAALLEAKGWVICLPEKVERYKTMYCGVIGGVMYLIHLHQEIAWHGMIALNKQSVFRRAQPVHPLVQIPSREDSILIHAAHVLFENFIIKEREKNYFLKLSEPTIDRDYLRWQIRQNRWESGFCKVIREKKISKAEIAKFWCIKIWRDPRTASYLFLKMLRIPLRKIRLRRKGYLIALIGVNGSGKSTLSKTLLKQYLLLTANLGKKGHYYYFGWNPTFIVTRWLSALLKRKNREIFKEINLKAAPPQKFDLLQEAQLTYLYFEFLYRYYTKICPLLKKGDLVVADRYFYDIYGQYPYAKHSKVARFLIGFFPKPDRTYVLDADLASLASRQKTDRLNSEVRSSPRIFLPHDYLQEQMINYRELARQFSFDLIDTSLDIHKNCNRIITDSWRECLSWHHKAP